MDGMPGASKAERSNSEGCLTRGRTPLVTQWIMSIVLLIHLLSSSLLSLLHPSRRTQA